MLFDTHAHLNDPAFDPDRAELMDGLAQKGIGLVMNAGCEGLFLHILNLVIGGIPGFPEFIQDVGIGRLIPKRIIALSEGDYP